MTPELTGNLISILISILIFLVFLYFFIVFTEQRKKDKEINDAMDEYIKHLDKRKSDNL